MITDFNLKKYCDQIASIFCKDSGNKIICTATISERLKNVFSNEGFINFLSRLDFGRCYESTFKNYRVDQNKNRRYIDLVLIDVITGEQKQVTWNWSMTGDFYLQLKNALSFYSYDVIQGSPVFDAGNYQSKRILYKRNDPSYGIVFVPANVDPTGKTPGNNTPPGNITPTPPVPTTPPIQPAGLSPDFDLQTILLIGGIGFAAWYLMKK